MCFKDINVLKTQPLQFLKTLIMDDFGSPTSDRVAIGAWAENAFGSYHVGVSRELCENAGEADFGSGVDWGRFDVSATSLKEPGDDSLSIIVRNRSEDA